MFYLVNDNCGKFLVISYSCIKREPTLRHN